MQKYAGEHSWRFDESDFDFEADGVFFADELREMPVGKLKQLARLRQVAADGLVEKADFVRALATSRAELLALPVGRLRACLKQRGLSSEGLVERDDWVRAIIAGHDVDG
jgi:hypothetical protein